jgi:hypothetical protein
VSSKDPHPSPAWFFFCGVEEGGGCPPNAEKGCAEPDFLVSGASTWAQVLRLRLRTTWDFCRAGMARHSYDGFGCLGHMTLEQVKGDPLRYMDKVFVGG